MGAAASVLRFDYSGNSHYGTLRWNGLQLGNNGQNKIIAGNTAPGGFLDFYVNNTNDAGSHTIAPNGIHAMRITNAGRVGIGMTAPSNALHVSGNIGATGWIGAGCEGACSSD